MSKSIASIALIRREAEGQTLWLAQWNEGWQSYHFVGGHKHEDETFRDCIVREIDEELGLREAADVVVASAPLAHLEYTDVSGRTGEHTDYVIELFDVALVGNEARGKIEANGANRWLSEPEIMAQRCDDGRLVSPTPVRFLNHLGWDLFVSYAHKDDQPDGWVSALVQAIRAEHAEFTPTPLRVFFDRQEIRSMDDWQRRIYDGLHASKLMLAVLSEHYFASDYCRQEWRQYRDHEIRRQMLGEAIAPVYIVTVPGFAESSGRLGDEWQLDLAGRQFVDVRDWRPHGVAALREMAVREQLRRLEQQLAERLARTRRQSESKSTVPRASERFVGRSRELTRLREALPQGKVAAITAVQGIGGIGKTALAFRYAQTFADHYPGGRFLVEAERLSDLRLVLVRLAPDLGLRFSEAEQRDDDLAAARVRTELERRGRTLLVLDNVDRPELLDARQRQRFLPGGDRLHVLVTTRLEEDAIQAAGLDCVPIDPLPDTDAIEMLHRHRAIHGDDEWKAALRIVHLLGGHALALEVVAVYLWRHPDVSYRGYLERLETEGVFAALSGTGADRAVKLSEHLVKLIGPLLEPTLAGLETPDAAPALRALEYAALLPPDAVALPWIRALVAADFPNELASRSGYADPWQQIERRLSGLRLWTRKEDDRLARVHRIVQEVVRARMPADRGAVQQEALALVVRIRAAALENAARLGDFAWEAEPLRDYVLARPRVDNANVLGVANAICTPLQHLGRLGDAATVARAAVACGERILAADPDNAAAQRDLSVSYSKLGDVSVAQGDLAGAKRYFEQSLNIDQLLAADPDNAAAQRDLSVSY
ncbi:MAG: TIR domain-containing protein, partial [Pirellulales bacterium]|nr:TIR domain-containing protein [Pirellulales bacterium]